MAGNHYGQQWPQNQAHQYQYDGRDHQPQRQEVGRGQGSYNQGYQGYNDYPRSGNGYGPGSAPAPPQNNGYDQWQGQDQYARQGGYDGPHYETANGPPRPRRDHYDQGQPPQDRQYQYDERYRTNGQGRPPPTGHSYAEDPRPQRDQWSQPSTPQKKRSKPRDRILTEPASPKTLAWDNPFGAFNDLGKPKPVAKEQRHQRHASLDQAMANLKLDERPGSGGSAPRQQAPTVRQKEVSRPSTSHDRRPDMGRSPPLQSYPMPPATNSPDMHFQQQPIPRPQERVDSPRMRPPGPQGPLRGPPPPSQQPQLRHDRPAPGPGPNRVREDQNCQPSHGAHGNDRPHEPLRRNRTFDEGYASDYIPQSRAHVSPIDYMLAGNQYQQAPQQDYYADPYRSQPPPNPTVHNQRVSNGLPDFDSIPTNVTERSEDNFIAGQKPSFDQNVYRKPTYQVPGAFAGEPGQTEPRGIQQSPPNQTNSPLAEFSFDLPVSNGRTNAARNGNPAQAAMYHGGHNEHIPGSRVASSRYGERQPQETPRSQYPPRAASRNGMKPSVENVASQPPLPNNGQPHRSFSQDNYPQRPHTSNAQRSTPQSYEMMNPYDQGYTNRAPSAPAAPVPFQQGFGPPGQNNQYQQSYGQGPPMRKASQDNYNQNQQFRQPFGQDPAIRQIPPGPYDQGLPKPNGNSSAHPVPVRHYGPPPDAETNPDALPAHPVPIRSGMNNGNGYQSTQSAPAQTPQRRVVSDSPQPVTLQELNSLRQMYSSNPGDQALGLKLAKKMVEAAKVLADEDGRADVKTAQKNREKYIFDAHKVIKKLVASNYPDAMFYLADCYGSGMLGLAVDAKEAFILYQSAAKLNHPQSAYRVAVCCELGSEEGGGTRRDPLKAMQWYKRAATLGDTPAMYKMGMILLKGLLSQQKNPREAVSWLKRAAERADKDNPHALHELGLLYEATAPPDNIVRDERYAIQLFQQAAELGYKYSQFRLGSAYEYGLIGCPIDARQSIAWYTRAAAQGEHQSELALSGWYLTGSEPLLTQSDTEAFLWARKAASSGLAKAEYAMGYFNEVGIGTAVDVEEAKRWYYRAASQNFAKARERLEELKRGGPKQQKTRMSRSNVNRQSDGECVVM
ncbi:hypothetical protein A1O7_03458 [Cladophialophora yegresii CBS 114405]|uniref:Uncharacterized protein n=1 Tax=Cladophialophora yegresii CBS 114405 TaxID=1182544 RepID=W9WXM3_9EURO|nr:uncharacterized protein A1O7_03458 [Cladophialophora yegresii CBS 114405]EXJ63014.1 hypothetical protein A1O7_03458 [Cladophialophora yegresii CBS 114405]